MHGLVSQDWLLAHLEDPGVRILQVDEDLLAYSLGHIPGAHGLRWDVDLGSTGGRDVVDAQGFATLMARLGAAPETTLVVYGDGGNLWAAYAYWVLRYWGHPEVRLLDGGHAGWAAAGLPLTTAEPRDEPALYPVPDAPLRALRAGATEVRALLGGGALLLDTRSASGFGGEPYAALGPPLSGAHRAGHIPGAVNLPWTTLSDKETFRYLPEDELRARYAAAGVRWDVPVVSYCIVGAASGLTLAILGDHLGHPAVRNYDGSWLEWGSSIGFPVEV